MTGSLESWPVAPREPIHLRPTAALAERVLLPGDPGRALALAQLLLEGPLMFNHHRGLWGYTGPALADGKPLTIQSTGMGGPSAAIVLQELIALGARRAIRVGTCGALAETGIRAGGACLPASAETGMLVDSGMLGATGIRAEGACHPASVKRVSPASVRGECPPAAAGGLALGDLVVAQEALATDGTSRSLGAGERIAADRELTAALESASTRCGATIVSTDLFYDPDPEREREWRTGGAVAVEMEAAALFAVGVRASVPVGCLLTVSNLLGDAEAEEQHIDDDALLAAVGAMGRVAVSALT
jgi:uridine phosphorylase